MLAKFDAIPFHTPTLPDVPDAGTTWLTWFVDYWNGPGAFAALPERMRASFEATVEICYGEVHSLLTDRTPAQVWATIEAPTLLVRGELSPIEARRIAETLANTLPHASLHDVRGAGHMSPVTHGDEVSNQIAEHMGRAG
jgi:pimeloyl-ACP methyl ester carboxylesterase